MRRVLVITCLFVLILMAIAAFFGPSPIPERGSHTKYLISQCYDGIWLVERASNQPVAKLLEGKVSNAELSKLIRPFAISRPLAARFNEAIPPMLVDAWGRTLNVSVDQADAIGSKNAVAGGTSTNYSIAIWSSGANGINEFGRGDDIVAPLEVNRMREP